MQEHKLFFKILSYFISLLIPILIIGSIIYVNVDRLVKEDVSDKLQANLKASVSNIDVNLEMVRTTHNNLLINDIVQSYLKPYSKQTYQDKIYASSIIRTIAANRSTLSAFIDSVFMYSDDQKVYTADGVVDFETFFGKFYEFEDYPQSYWKGQLQKDSIFQVLKPTNVRISADSNRTVIPEVTTQYVNGSLVTSVTTIPVRSILRTLENNSLYASTSYIVTDSNNTMLMSTSKLGDDQIGELERQFSAADGAAQRNMELGGESMVVTYLSSSSFGWNYYSATPVSAFNYESSSLLTMIFWICVSLVVIGIVFSLIFSLRLYNPIRNIRGILISDARRKDDDREPGWDRGGFGDIGRRIRQLMEEKTDISARLQDLSADRVEEYFRSLIEGRQRLEAEGDSQIRREIGFERGEYLCCCFLFQFRDRFYREIEEADRVLVLEKLKIVLSGIMGRHVPSYVLEYEHNLYVCMVNLREPEERAKLDEALRTIRLTFEYDMVYCDLSIGIGHVYPDMAKLASSYSEAITAVDRVRSRPDAPIADAAELEIGRVYYYSFLDESKIVNAMKIGDFELLGRELRELVDENRERGVAYSHLGSLLADVYQTGYRYLAERNQDIFRFVSEAQHRTLMQKHVAPTEWEERMELLLDFFKRIIEETFSKLKPDRKSASVVAFISEYISLHYAEDLHLEKIADEIGLSPKYVSRLYKDSTGSSITDTISRIRMDKAKELLLGTDLKVGEIAERIGIASRTTFLRLFKKHEGISPMDYRNAHGRKEAGDL